jgi:hypothetical protein
MKFKGGYVKREFKEYPSRSVRQKTEIINGDLLRTDGKVKKAYLDNSIYKITLEGYCIEYWSEKAPWYIYFEADDKIMHGYLKECHFAN